VWTDPRRNRAEPEQPAPCPQAPGDEPIGQWIALINLWTLCDGCFKLIWHLVHNPQDLLTTIYDINTNPR